jgi:hypothetical protein
MVRGLALETKMNSFLVCKMNLWRFEMHSKNFIHLLKGKKNPYLFCKINFWNFDSTNAFKTIYISSIRFEGYRLRWCCSYYYWQEVIYEILVHKLMCYTSYMYVHVYGFFEWRIWRSPYTLWGMGTRTRT